jgi:GTP-binding protein LepA
LAGMSSWNPAPSSRSVHNAGAGPRAPDQRIPHARLNAMALARIRNFSIVAHIDHGKSTLADRLLALTGTMDAKKAVDQVLDSMDLERERGITIKAHTVRLLYRAGDGHQYTLNLIDTPGHVDFSYEVSRALAACEGALLIVDAAQGIEAQTLANYYLARDANLSIIPVLNKIDLPAADVEGTRTQLTEMLDLDGDDALAISAKHGTGVPEVLEAIVSRIPPPVGDPEAPLKALVFDSFYDSYQGVVIYVRLVDGRVRVGTRILLMSNGRAYDVQQVGVFSPDMRPVDELSAGQVGYLTASIKRVADAKVGETITEALRPTATPFPGYRDAKPMVFAGLYPIEDSDYEGLRDALEKLRLNDPAFTFEPETSLALGYGFRCGFLGMLHLEIVQERLEREFALSLIVTAPSVEYRVLTTAGEVLDIENPSKLPTPDRIELMEEPYVSASVFVPTEYMTIIYKLAQDKRGEHKSLEYLGKRVHIRFDFPLAEIVVDFYDKLKSVSKGYASFDYEFADFRPSDLVKLDILLNGDPVDALSSIVHRDKAYERGKALVEKLRAVIPRQLFEVAIQAAVGSRVIARETVKAMGKNVTAKCYGGDITRKRKLLERQKEGKKRMKQVGKVEVPQEAFLSVLKS